MIKMNEDLLWANSSLNALGAVQFIWFYLGKEILVALKLMEKIRKIFMIKIMISMLN